MSSYDKIAQIYDSINSDVDYAGYAEAVTEFLKKAGVSEGSLVLDLACGTGKMTRELKRQGYDMIGVDISEEMLSKAKSGGDEGILYLLQDMTEFELYGTVAATICTLDGINHLTDNGDVRKCFSLVHNYSDPDGVFIFDVNTPYKFEEVYADRDYVIEDEGYVLTWQNEYDAETGECDFFFSLFEENENGEYTRTDTEWSEHCYGKNELVEMLTNAGFTDIKITSANLKDEPAPNAERWYITAKAVK